MNPIANTNDYLIRLPRVIQLTALGRTTIYELTKNGTFPRPVKLSARAVAWSATAVQAWINARIGGQPYPIAA